MKAVAYTLAATATLAQLLPLLAIVPSWLRTSEVRKWIAVWCVLFFVSDVLQLAVSRLQFNNMWLALFVNPCEDGLILWILSFWQTRPVWRIAFRVAIPIVILTYLVIALSTGPVDAYQMFAGPFRALVILTASLFTLLSRISIETGRIRDRDWLWATLGVSLYYGLQVAADPIAGSISRQDGSFGRAVFTVKAVGDVAAFVLLWRGMRCPIQPTYSGST